MILRYTKALLQGRTPAQYDFDLATKGWAFSSPEKLQRIAETAAELLDKIAGPDPQRTEMTRVIKEAAMAENAVYWLSPLGDKDDFGDTYTDVMYDAATIHGPWANMTQASFEKFGRGKLGTGLGQKYKKQADGRWLKVEG